MTEIYIQHIERCLSNANKYESKLSTDILRMDGMSGLKTRHFYNNMLSISDARYLEIGTWKGSSVCSAMFENNAKVTCIDNWSLFKGPKSEFIINLNKYKGTNQVEFIEQDCFTVDVATLQKFNIYLYDGDHSVESQYKALTYYINCLDDIFILMVDDWNWKNVRDGTHKAIKDLNLKVEYQKEIRLTRNNKHTPKYIARRSWWNGIYIAVLSKPASTIITLTDLHNETSSLKTNE